MPSHGKAETRPLRVILRVEQINYLRLEGGRRNLSVSALLRELVQREMDRNKKNAT